MARSSKLLEAIGGRAAAEAVGLVVERAADEQVAFLGDPERSRCGAFRVVVTARPKAAGGGYAVEWYAGGEDGVEVASECEVGRADRILPALERDVKAVAAT